MTLPYSEAFQSQLHLMLKKLLCNTTYTDLIIDKAEDKMKVEVTKIIYQGKI